MHEHRGSRFEWAHSDAERQRLWHARHQAYWASIAMKPRGRGFPTDVCVPVSALPQCVLRSKALVDKHGLMAPMVGHVGDGNFHMMLMVDPDDAGALRKPCWIRYGVDASCVRTASGADACPVVDQ